MPWKKLAMKMSLGAALTAIVVIYPALTGLVIGGLCGFYAYEGAAE